MDQHHQPLDFDELLDDDMRALAALGRDVDMAMDVEGFGPLATTGAYDFDTNDAMDNRNAIIDSDNDVFRPSALLDRRMVDEFGGAFYSSCLQASELLPDDDDNFVDIEQMLLSESSELLAAHFAPDSSSEMDVMTPSTDCAAIQHHEITARHFAASVPPQQPLVVLNHALASSSVPSSFAIAAMPPKYFANVAASPQKRRVHRRTFGERTPRAQSLFVFHGNSSTSRPSCPSHSSVVRPTDVPQASFRAPVVAAHSSVDTLQQQQQQQVQPAVDDDNDTMLATPAEPMDETNDDDNDDRELQALAAASVPLPINESERDQTQTPVPSSFRSISDDDDLLHTPVRLTELIAPTASTAATTSATVGSMLERTPQSLVLLESRSMSPADALDKVVAAGHVVHVLNERDAAGAAASSPGRFETLEWRIGNSPQTHLQTRKRRASLSTQFSSAEEADALMSTHPIDGQSAALLPPRYFQNGTSSPQKRRVHSSTFSTFARTFSFTGGSSSSSGSAAQSSDL